MSNKDWFTREDRDAGRPKQGKGVLLHHPSSSQVEIVTLGEEHKRRIEAEAKLEKIRALYAEWGESEHYSGNILLQIGKVFEGE